MIIDVRLVQGPDGRWRASIEGKRVHRVSGPSPSAALDALALALEGAAWLARQTEQDVACAQHGPLFEPAGTPCPTVMGDPNDGGRCS